MNEPAFFIQTQRGFIGLLALLAIVIGITVISGGAYLAVRQGAVPRQPVAPATSTPAGTGGTLTATPVSGAAPLTVSFSTTYAYPEWYPGSTGLSVEFGDGTGGPITVGSVAKHRYATPGTFTATLGGCSLDTDLYCAPATFGSTTITVTGAAAATANTTRFTAAPATGGAPLTVHFSATDPSRYDPDGVYAIDFGDSKAGPQDVPATCTSATCTISVDHVYALGGIFTPTLYWTAGCHTGVGGDCALINENIANTKVNVGGTSGAATTTANPPLGGTTQKSACDLATMDFLSGKITPEAWHGACGTTGMNI